MNQKHLLFFIVIALAMGMLLFVKEMNVPPEYSNQETALIMKEFKPERITRIEISKGEETIQLIRENDTWVVPTLWGITASEERIVDLLLAVKDLKGEERARSKELYPDFGITEKMAVHLVFKEDDKPRLHLLLGTQKPRWKNVFIRKAESEAVYLAETDIFPLLGIMGEIATAKLKAEHWADLSILSLSVDDLSKVEIRDKRQWYDPTEALPFEASMEPIQTYYRELTQLRAKTVVDPAASNYGLDKPVWQLRVSIREKDPLMISVGAQQEGTTDRYVRAGDSPFVYVMTEYGLSRLRGDRAKWIRNNPFKIDKSLIESIRVQTPTEEAQVAWIPASWPELESYFKALRGLTLQAVADPDEQYANDGRNWIEFTFRDKTQAKLTCHSSPEEGGQMLPCRWSQSSIDFKLGGWTYKQLFEDLNGLAMPKVAIPEDAKATEAPAPTAS